MTWIASEGLLDSVHLWLCVQKRWLDQIGCRKPNIWLTLVKWLITSAHTNRNTAANLKSTWESDFVISEPKKERKNSLSMFSCGSEQNGALNWSPDKCLYSFQWLLGLSATSESKRPSCESNSLWRFKNTAFSISVHDPSFMWEKKNLDSITHLLTSALG